MKIRPCVLLSMLLFLCSSFLLREAWGNSVDKDVMMYEKNLSSQGLLAYERGDWFEARNNWFKLFEIRKARSEEDDESIKKIRPLYDRATTLLKEKYVKNYPDSPPVEAKEEKKKARRKRKKKKAEIQAEAEVLTQMKKSQRDSLAELQRKAAVAENHGQLEEAARFYRLAGQLDPSSPEIKKQIERIEKLIN